MALMVLVLPTTAGAQNDDDEVEAYVGADMVSHYMWRGQDRGGFSFQPEAYVSWKGLTVKMMGSAGFESTDPREIDITLGYETAGFNIGVIDYWKTGLDPNDRYFYFDKKGGHRVEGNIGYSWKYGSLQAYAIFWGNDFKIDGKQAYSTYVEMSVPFKLGGVNWKVAVGGTPFESAGHNETVSENGVTKQIPDYDYAEGPACVMASLRAQKNIELGFASLPVFAEFHANPYLQTANVLFGITISPF